MPATNTPTPVVKTMAQRRGQEFQKVLNWNYVQRCAARTEASGSRQLHAQVEIDDGAVLSQTMTRPQQVIE